MPKIDVQIDWDFPDEKNWLNTFNIEVALRSYCKNTNFNVTELYIDKVPDEPLPEVNKNELETIRKGYGED